MIYWQIKSLSFIIHGLAFIEYSFSSTDFKNQDENCISETENCSSVDGKVICYRVCSYKGLSWNDAQRICANHNSTLPVIRNEKEQESLEAYLKAHTAISGAVWTSGRKITHKKWTWLDGQPFRAQLSWKNGSINSEYNTHATMERDKKFKKENPLNPSWYMCQYRGNLCHSNESFNLTNGCVVLSDNDTSWYNARNVCLDGGGDLAVLRDEDLKILKDHPSSFIKENYWIGLGNISWQWKYLNNKTEDVKYSKWSRSIFPLDSDVCISINTSNGEWLARRCNDGLSVICQNERNTSTNATSISPSSTSGPGTSSTSTNNPTVSANVMYAMICGGVLLVFICIIFIFLLVRRRLKGTKEIRSSKGNTMQSKTGSGPEEKPTKKIPRTTTAPEDDALGVYAEISPPKNSNKDLENAPSINPHQPSGTVYASLEFKKDAIYAEPVKKSNTANAQTK